MQKVPETAAKCPNCGSPQVRSHRKQILIALASGMILAMLLVVYFMVRHASVPVDVDPDAPSTPTAPDKPPPLNQ
jgi:uncharacterized integral membrane protein